MDSYPDGLQQFMVATGGAHGVLTTGLTRWTFQFVTITMRPLAAVRAATRVIAAVGLARSVPIPAISAPSAKPKSRQKRYTLTTRARSRGWVASETAAIRV